MNSVTRAFLDGMLLENPAFMTYVGALMVAVLPRSARSSYRSAARFGVVFFFASTVGATITGAFTTIPAPLVYFSVALVAVKVLMQLGELDTEWMGMPQGLLALAPLIGIQALLAAHADFAHIVAGAGGQAVGFWGAYIIIGSIREYSRISEASDTFKTNPVVLFSMAIFALIMAGFLFW